ncbi:MAG: PEP-CTERM system TPR-repeat protein PrsT [Colwellia sp.]|nr:PEP-CTERM system TPR-repeat protein PrsT [Colwellia sp.]
MGNNSKLAIPILMVALLLSACSENKTAEEYVASAVVALDHGDVQTAVINLKNVLRKDANNPQARLLLGKIYLESGSGVNAEKELLKAYELGNREAAILLLRAYKIQNKYDEIIELSTGLSLNESEDWALVEVYKALSFFKLEKEDLANRAINNAIEVSGESAYGKLGAAYLATREQKNNEALTIVDDLLKENPNFIDALILKGQLSFSNKDFESAGIAFRQYLDLQPEDLTMKLMLANAYFKGRSFDKSEILIDEVLQIVPNHAFTNQLKGSIRFQKQDFIKGTLFIEKAIQGGINSISNKVLAGISAFHLKNYEQSYSYLNSVKKDLPKNHLALKLLAIAQLKLGYSSEASNTLDSFSNLTSKDIELYTAASFELLKQGKTTLARNIQNKVANIELSEPMDITRKGFLQLSLGDIDGIGSLEKALSIDESIPEAKMMLAMAYVDNNEPNKAMNLLNDWIMKEPTNVEPYNLMAVISNKINDKSRLESSLTKALELDELNPMSLLYFAEKDMNNDRFTEAEDKLLRLLEDKPNHIQALSSFYLLSDKMGNREPAKIKIKDAYERNVSDINYRLLQAKSLMIDSNAQGVITLLAAVNNDEPLPNMYWVSLGDSYLALGELDKGIEVFTKWSKVSPENSTSWIRASMILEIKKDYTKGLLFINRGLKAIPEDLRLALLQIHFNIQVNDLDESQVLIDKLHPKVQELPSVQGLQGKVWANRKMYDIALPKLLVSYENSPITKNAGLVYIVYNNLNMEEDATLFLQEHIKNHPTDHILRHILADKLSKNDDALAYQHYSAIYEQNNKNHAVLNNMAWLDYKNGHYEKAKNTIEKALELSPNNPNILDTAGIILLALGEKSDALKYLEKALLYAPDNADIKKHLKDAQ